LKAIDRLKKKEERIMKDSRRVKKEEKVLEANEADVIAANVYLDSENS
jgi:hypothetical protein